MRQIIKLLDFIGLFLPNVLPQNFDFSQDCFHKFKIFPSLRKIAFVNCYNPSRIYEEKENICKN